MPSVYAPRGHRPLAQGWTAKGWPTLGQLKEGETTPKGLRQIRRHSLRSGLSFGGRNPFGVDGETRLWSQGSGSAPQPWAMGLNPVGIPGGRKQSETHNEPNLYSPSK